MWPGNQDPTATVTVSSIGQNFNNLAKITWKISPHAMTQDNQMTSKLLLNSYRRKIWPRKAAYSRSTSTWSELKLLTTWPTLLDQDKTSYHSPRTFKRVRVIDITTKNQIIMRAKQNLAQPTNRLPFWCSPWRRWEDEAGMAALSSWGSPGTKWTSLELAMT